MPRAIREHELERMIDTEVDRLLRADSAYRNAEDAESQAEREAEVTAIVEADFRARYAVA